MRFSRRIGLLCIGVLMLAGAATQAAHYSHRQYYSSWYPRSSHSYYYRSYYYKPYEEYTGYRTHYCIYYPERPQYYYYWNPYKKVYWGRCPTNYGGEEQYSLLPESALRASLEEIPEKAFPPLSKTPPIPESKDGVKLDLPPDEPPPDGKTAALPVG